MKRLWLTIILVYSTLVKAADLGTWGDLYPITEPDMLMTIYNRLHDMEQSGELAKQQAAFKQRVIKNSLRPAPVTGLTVAQEDSTHYVDPSFVVSQDMADHQGRIFAHTGERHNPLEFVPFVQTLYFIDADDPRQMAWLKQQKPATPVHKVILVKGDIRASTLALDTRIYFDQQGLMSRKFALTAVPARVTASKEGKRLRVETFAIKKPP
ncbi:type-F conjugative transfer system protein TraW [Candidatus Fukatsuia symbiotica]|uniref:Type-F conjugative transfer system protein TraW n=1 Tax=Candidatus Fukatsuia symbiotica TaxID=1878942 RepID=A0A2U8I7H7_9GAMM|nr:type-F conjugative transfer system protein TraW [Candidatus Fukatsuia symbiotica]AWK15131.1 type-F conjugative transfer system protein TraW [Candidatus Fukatsuia symbiotica]MEA9443951.1 type-F conjugative transfer system protein TraW [Candidatus Fukatsuia symbiotica]